MMSFILFPHLKVIKKQENGQAKGFIIIIIIITTTKVKLKWVENKQFLACFYWK